MSKPLILSLQRPQNDGVLAALIEGGGFDIALFAEGLSDKLQSASANAGTRLIPIERVALDSTTRDAAVRAELVGASLSQVVAAHAEVDAYGRADVVQAMAALLRPRMQASMEVVDALENVRRTNPDVALIVNETDLHVSRTAALWARRHGFPIFMISARTNLGDPTTVTRRMIADYFFVFGERAAEPYLDLGVPADRIAITGNPAWDHYGEVLARRGQYRSEVFTKLGLKAGAPLFVFATTWNAKLSSLLDASIYEHTLKLFLEACKYLSDHGAAFNVVIKDLPGKEKIGRQLAAQVGADAGFNAFSYVAGDMPVYLCAADALVGYDASVFLECMMAGVPAANIWAPSSWLLGPAMEAVDGVPLFAYDEPEPLAAFLQSIIDDPSVKTRYLKAQQERLRHFHVPADGKSAHRCAHEIMKRLDKIGEGRRVI